MSENSIEIREVDEGRTSGKKLRWLKALGGK
jgi:hypothetical protein